MNWSGEMSFHWGIICQYASPLASAAQWLKGWPRNFRAASDCRCGNNCRRHALMLFWAIARLRVGMVTLSMQRQRIGRGQSGRKGGWKGEVRQFFNPSHCQPDELLYEQVVPRIAGYGEVSRVQLERPSLTLLPCSRGSRSSNTSFSPTNACYTVIASKS